MVGNNVETIGCTCNGESDQARIPPSIVRCRAMARLSPTLQCKINSGSTRDGNVSQIELL